MGEKKADIKVGFLCNNNCRFCVVANKRNLGNKTTKQVRDELYEARKTCSAVLFTGGEPTIRKDVFELAGYAKELRFELIQLQTNGRMLAYKDFCRKIVNAGVNSFAPALHGHKAELHDFLTRVSGSFDQTSKGIKNVKELGQQVIMNCVVTKPNYRYLPEIAKLFVKLGVDQYQMAFVHPVGNAYTNFDSIVPRMSLAAPYIKKSLRVGIDAGIRVMAEAFPYCMMQGYEDYISEKFVPRTEIYEMNNFVNEWEELRKKIKSKFPQCNECKYDKICEGPWKEYPERVGCDEFKAVK